MVEIKVKIWATSWPNQQNGMCAQWRLWLAWASAQSDQSSLSACRKLGSFATHWAHSEESDQTGRMPRLIWVFAGRTFILLVLSWGGSIIISYVLVYSMMQFLRSGGVSVQEGRNIRLFHKCPGQCYWCDLWIPVHFCLLFGVSVIYLSESPTW